MERPLGRVRVRAAWIAVAAASFLMMGAALADHAGGDTTGRPKILGIAYVRIRVTDLEKAKAFYGEVLGLERNDSKNGDGVQATFLVNGNQTVELSKTASNASGSYLEEIGLATDNVAKMRTYLTAKGIPADKIFTKPDGRSWFATRDPEENKIVFVERKKSSEESAAPGAISHKLLHAGFVVRDWKTESRFYEDALGFRLYWKGGFKDDGLDWYEIQVPDGDNWIEYMLNIPANADHKELGVQNHFSLGVPKAEGAAATLRSRGQKEFDGPEIGRDGKNALDVYDPDSTRVEVMEFTPAQKPCCAEYTGPHPKP
jgi:catechol 2,3-dioxygenase-like lactoylglutathione lyase family enzyme